MEQWGGEKEEVPALDGAGDHAPEGVEERAKQAAGAKAQVAAEAGVKVLVKPQKRPTQ